MANMLSLNGAQPQKQVRFSPIYTGRWFQGLYTNRSPLRMGGLNWITEKFYGGQNDALIDGLNTEISNRLTLQRRPGNPSFPGSATFNNVDRFESFRLFGTNTEQIDVMIDEAGALYTSLTTRTLVFTKSSGAGQTFMQSVGNSLYFGNGVDQKKWLQSLTVWASGATWNGPSTPFLTTFLTDSNGNIQQLIAAVLTISHVQVAGTTLTITCTAGQIASTGLVIGDSIFFQDVTTTTVLNNTTVVVTNISGNTFQAVTALGATNVADTGKAIITVGRTPTSKTGAHPTWSTVVLAPSATDWPINPNQLTVDGTALWVTRSLAVGGVQQSGLFNWGIAAPTQKLSPSIGGTQGAWAANTYYSPDSVIIDSNGHIQQVTTGGVSGAGSHPAWANSVGVTTADGSVTWTCFQTANLTWAAHTQYAPGQYVIATAGGASCLFKLQPIQVSEIIQQPGSPQPHTSTGDYVNLYFYDTSANSNPGQFTPNPATTGAASAHVKVNSLLFNVINSGVNPNIQPIQNDTLNQSGEITGNTNPWAGANQRWSMVVLCSLNVSQSLFNATGGQLSIVITHDDGMYFGMDGGASLVSGPNVDPGNGGSNPGTTALNAYPTMGGNNANTSINGNKVFVDTYVVQVPAAGQFNCEFDFYQWEDQQCFFVQIQGYTPIPIANATNLATMTTAPLWPAFNTAPAPAYPSVTEQSSFGSFIQGGGMIWANQGPVTDFVWAASKNFHLSSQNQITDPNGNFQFPYRTGYTGSTQTNAWQTALNALTNDPNPNLIWINQGPNNGGTAVGPLSTFNGGWSYGIALVNTLDNTVSNIGPLTSPTALSQTGNFIGATAIGFPAGSGLPAPAQIDPQADYVAIFRTTDGQSVPFLIPGTGNSVYTLPLNEYLEFGYNDITPDTGLNNLISAPIGGENTPPLPGAINLTFHLNRIFFSVGNVVYWTSGPDTPVGNGVNGVAPENFDEFPSLVKRLIPTSVGLFVFTVSDMYLIPGQGTANNPIMSGQPFLQGVGILSYNAVGVNGSIVGFFTTDGQFLILDPSAGTVYAGHAIGDKLRQSNGQPGTNWNPANVYVTWHVNGEDQAWYVSDGQLGWYRMCPTPAPESPGITWSPFAAIVGGCKAVQSIETSPGHHDLLLGPTGSGVILERSSSLSVFTDNAATYPAYAIIGSIVLVNPGQVAEVQFITTDAVRVGTPLTLGILLDEAFPYYTLPFETLKTWETDPTSRPKSRSVLGQRFYLSDNPGVTALCRHMQVKIQWVQEAAQNELLSISVFGGFFQES